MAVKGLTQEGLLHPLVLIIHGGFALGLEESMAALQTASYSLHILTSRGESRPVVAAWSLANGVHTSNVLD